MGGGRGNGPSCTESTLRPAAFSRPCPCILAHNHHYTPGSLFPDHGVHRCSHPPSEWTGRPSSCNIAGKLYGSRQVPSFSLTSGRRPGPRSPRIPASTQISRRIAQSRLVADCGRPRTASSGGNGKVGLEWDGTMSLIDKLFVPVTPSSQTGSRLTSMIRVTVKGGMGAGAGRSAEQRHVSIGDMGLTAGLLSTPRHVVSPAGLATTSARSD
jgi:hypothetical protein